MKKTLLSLVLLSGCVQDDRITPTQRIPVEKLVIGDERHSILYFDGQDILQRKDLRGGYACEHNEHFTKYLPMRFPLYQDGVPVKTLLVIKDLPSGQQGYADLFTVQSALSSCTYAIAHISSETGISFTSRTDQ